MDTHGWPYVFDRHSNLEIIGTLQVHKSQIHVVQFSPDGKYLASGDDNGILIVRKTTKNWPRIRTYRTGRAIRALVWHPTINGTVVVGSGSGELNTLKLAPTSAEEDLTALLTFPGYIHALAFNSNGTQLAVAFGIRGEIALVRQIQDFDLDRSRISSSITVQEGHWPIRGLHYLSDQVLIIVPSFYPGLGSTPGIMAYSTQPPYEKLWKFDLRSGAGAGGSALSPSRKLLAITNLIDGVDWYSVEDQDFRCTTEYELGNNYMIDVAFLDETTVITGSGHGRLIIANHMEKHVHVMKIDKAGVIQALATEIVGGTLTIAAATSFTLDKHKEDAVRNVFIAVDKRDRNRKKPQLVKSTGRGDLLAAEMKNDHLRPERVDPRYPHNAFNGVKTFFHWLVPGSLMIAAWIAGSSIAQRQDPEPANRHVCPQIIVVPVIEYRRITTTVTQTSTSEATAH